MFFVQPVFSTRFSRHSDGYRCRRGEREKETHAYVTHERHGVHRQRVRPRPRPLSAQKPDHNFVGRVEKESGPDFHERSPRDSARPGLASVVPSWFTPSPCTALSVLSSPSPSSFVFIYLPLYILRPSTFHSPASLACAQAALNLPLRAASRNRRAGDKPRIASYVSPAFYGTVS